MQTDPFVTIVRPHNFNVWPPPDFFTDKKECLFYKISN